MSEQERNKEVIRAVLEAADRGDLDAIAARYAADYRDHSDGGSRIGGDRDGALTAFRELASAFPRLRHRVLDLIAEGDKVVLRVSATATHSGEFRGIPPTGRVVVMNKTVIYRLRDGFIVDRWLDSAESVGEQLEDGGPDPGTAPDTAAGIQLLRAASAEWAGDASGGSFWELRLANVSLTCFRLDPGTRFPPHRHIAEQITLVLEGRLTFEVDGGEHVLGPGDAIAVPSGVDHAVRSEGEAVLAIDAWSPPPVHLGTRSTP